MKNVFKIGGMAMKLPFLPKLSDPDRAALKQAYDRLIFSVAGYYRDVGAVFEKNANADRGAVMEQGDAMPADGHDMYNYVARYKMANCQLQAIMKLDGRIDFDRLSKAVRLSVDSEPVFGCRFVENEPPYWKRLDDLDHVRFCSLEETDAAEDALQEFVDSPLDMDHDPMVKLKVIRSKECDVLGVKISHACCDGAGVKEYIKLLSDIYSCIDQEYGVFIPKPRIRTRKDQDRLFEALGITDPDAAFIPGSEILLPTWPFPWRQVGSNTTHVEVCRLYREQFDEIAGYAKSRGATINDLILTALFRALQAAGQPIYGFPMEIPVTFDLRRYLPDHKTGAIRNFSGSVNIRLSVVADESFDDTLSRVIPAMNEIKKGYPGLQSAIGLERIEKMSFHDTLAYYQVGPKGTEIAGQCPIYCGDKCIPTLSNLGYVSKSLLRFGRCAVVDACIIPPVVRAPGLLFMVSTYNGILTLSAGFYEGTVGKGVVGRLLEKIKSELAEGTDD